MKKPNATGKESRQFDRDELRTLARESDERGAPEWVSRSLMEQVEDSAE